VIQGDRARSSGVSVMKPSPASGRWRGPRGFIAAFCDLENAKEATITL
jgi:hypothetical protein